MSYIKWEEVITPDFMKKPSTIVLEAGNGTGKTQSMCDFAVYLQKLGVFDRIYFFQYSHRGCENVVNKIVNLGGWAIWYVGMERFCPHFSQFSSFINMGVPPSYFCYFCPYFKNKSKVAYKLLEKQFTSSNKSVILPSLSSPTLLQQSKVCTYPLLKAITVSPTYDSILRNLISETPIFVIPSQLFFQFGLAEMWREFLRRQRKPRKVLFIIDEADTVFYNSIRVEIPDVQPSRIDYDIMKSFSPKTRKLTKILDIYPSVLKILAESYSRRGVMISELSSKLNKLVRSVENEVRSFKRRRKLITDYVVSNNIKTNVFRIVQVIEALLSTPNLEYALKTVEFDGRNYIMENYEYGVDLLLNPSFPWKYVWKILLTATFPSKKLLTSRILSPRSKSVLSKVRYFTRTYENVYVSTVRIYDRTEYTLLNRNKEVVDAVPKILDAIKLLIEFYKEKFGSEPRGVIVWFGNSTQYRNFFDVLRRKLRIKVGRKYTTLKIYGVRCFFSFVGSEISRGLDFTNYDISVALGPLLRPPRNIGFLDMLDFGRAVAEVVQSCMRIVRSPRPSKPKLVVVEESMLTPFYQEFYPSWFIELLNSRFLELPASGAMESPIV